MGAAVEPKVPRVLPVVSNNDDWRWQAQNTITTLEELSKHLDLTEAEIEGIERTKHEGLPFSVTPYYLSLCDPVDPNCPIRLQCIPRSEERCSVPGDLRDPLGEETNEVAPNLICRYPDRALLIVTDRCAVYCRFCTRSRMVGNGGGMRSLRSLEPAFEWLRSNPQIRDVIVSGGDPLVARTERVTQVVRELNRLGLDTVRIATRTPVTLPQRIEPALAKSLRASHPSVWIMTHFNHPKELTTESTQALDTLIDAGLPVMNQSVLLKGVNDRADTLEKLFRGLVSRRVRPYYLLQADLVRGTSHLRTPLSQGRGLMSALEGRVSGIALPKFIVDTPNGRGKVHVGPSNIVNAHDGCTSLRTFRGENVDYMDPPA
ncbi:MAG: KamA family radical SAM protein [Myxococcota bacterium]